MNKNERYFPFLPFSALVWPVSRRNTFLCCTYISNIPDQPAEEESPTITVTPMVVVTESQSSNEVISTSTSVTSTSTTSQAPTTTPVAATTTIASTTSTAKPTTMQEVLIDAATDAIRTPSTVEVSEQTTPFTNDRKVIFVTKGQLCVSPFFCGFGGDNFIF